MVNTPANPSGKVFTHVELEVIADVAIRHNLVVFTDEIYEHFLYDGRTHTSPASLPAMADRTVTISGVSKTFSITGWRIGYSASNDHWAKMIGYLNDLIYVCAPTPLQVGVARGLETLSPGYYAQLAAEYAVKRDKICGALSQAKLTPYVPQGAYYVLADVSRLPGNTSKERAMSLLHKTGVASVPGSAFYHGSDGENLTRFCFAKKPEDLDEACVRLERLS
jgi:aminotransferase